MSQRHIGRLAFIVRYVSRREHARSSLMALQDQVLGRYLAANWCPAPIFGARGAPPDQRGMNG